MTTEKLFLANAASFTKALGTMHFDAHNQQKSDFFDAKASTLKKDVNKRK